MNIIDIIFPKRCIICRQDGADICQKCIKNAQKYKIHHTNDGFYGYLYSMELRRLLINYKFNGKKSYINGLSKLFLERLKEENFDDFDVISYVPISRKRLRERGFNQSKLICEKICKAKGKKATKIFVKKQNKRQASLLKHAREENVRNKFLLKYDVKDKNVLIFDDVETTGATMREIEKTLKNAGAKRVVKCILFKNKK